MRGTWEGGRVSSPEIEVRPCRPADVPVLTATEPPGALLARQFFAGQQAGSIVYLVGWLDGTPAGTGILTRGARPELKNLQVREGFRDRGVGRAIIESAELLARDAGILLIGVGIDNPDAQRLYHRLGFRPTGRLTSTTYRYFDDDGIEREVTETAQDLEKVLGRTGSGRPPADAP